MNMEIEKKIQIWRVKNQIGLLTEMNCVLETLPSCWKILWKKIIENAGFSAKLRYVKGCGCHYMRVFCMESPPREKPHLGFPQNRWKYQGHLSIYSATVNQCEVRIPYLYIIKGYFTYQIFTHQSLIAD